MRDEMVAARTSGLTHYFSQTAVLENLSVTIPRGQVTALVGHNGAGKTTLIRILLGLLAPTRGRSEILGCDSQLLMPETRMKIGYLAEGHFLWRWMNAEDVGRFQRDTFAQWDHGLFDAMLRFFDVSPRQKVRNLSRGQRAGVSLAMTLATDPELLVLDDPSMGLDPVARRALVEGLLAFARREERTVLICTHLLDDVERLADRIAILSQGQIVVDAQLSGFRERVRGWTIPGAFDTSRVRQIPGLVDSRVVGDRLRVIVADPGQEAEAAIRRLSSTACEEALPLEDAVLAYLRPAAMVVSVSEAIGSSR